MEKSLFSFPVNNIKFQERPLSLDANYRLQWKLPLILWLIFKLSGRGSVSMKRLGLFNWALQSADLFSLLDEIIIHSNRIAITAIKHEPNLSRCVLYLRALGLIEIHDGKYNLTPRGREISLELDSKEDLFSAEKMRLKKYRTNQISESYINRILNGK